MRQELLEKLEQFDLIPAWLNALPGRTGYNVEYLKAAGIFDQGITLRDVAEGKLHGSGLRSLEKALEELIEIGEVELSGVKNYLFSFHTTNTKGMRIKNVILSDTDFSITDSWSAGTYKKHMGHDGKVKHRMFFDENDILLSSVTVISEIKDLKEGRLKTEFAVDPNTGVKVTKERHLKIVDFNEDGTVKKIDIIDTLDGKVDKKTRFRVHMPNNRVLGPIIILNTREEGEKKSIVYLKDGRLVSNNTSLFSHVKMDYFDMGPRKLVKRNIMSGKDHRIWYDFDDCGYCTRVKVLIHDELNPHHNVVERLIFNA